MKKNIGRNNEKGLSMAIILLLLLVCVVMAVVTGGMAIFNLHYSQITASKIVANYAAEAGIAKAIYCLYEATDYYYDANLTYSTPELPGASGALNETLPLNSGTSYYITFNSAQPYYSVNNIWGNTSVPGWGGFQVPPNSIYVISSSQVSGTSNYVRIAALIQLRCPEEAEDAIFSNGYINLNNSSGASTVATITGKVFSNFRRTKSGTYSVKLGTGSKVITPAAYEVGGVVPVRRKASSWGPFGNSATSVSSLNGATRVDGTTLLTYADNGAYTLQQPLPFITVDITTTVGSAASNPAVAKPYGTNTATDVTLTPGSVITQDTYFPGNVTVTGDLMVSPGVKVYINKSLTASGVITSGNFITDTRYVPKIYINGSTTGGGGATYGCTFNFGTPSQIPFGGVAILANNDINFNLSFSHYTGNYFTGFLYSLGNIQLPNMAGTSINFTGGIYAKGNVTGGGDNATITLQSLYPNTIQRLIRLKIIGLKFL
ncbi:MAG: hypothetical protein M1536_00215 [Firmicutes bacterium]|nr:hypothetical protein [Bacillota bacterium]